MKYAAIADWAEQEAYPLDFMCDFLGVSRSGFYAWRDRGPSDREIEDRRLTAIISNLHRHLRGNPGVRRIRAELRVLGERVSAKRVWRLMKAAGLEGRHPKAWRRTTLPGDRPVAAPDLFGRDFTAQAPNQKWCGDITYIKTWEGWAYLATVIDVYSRKVIGWAIADHMRTELVIEALDMAVRHRRPPAGVIFHSDKGCQYTSRKFADYCTNHKIRRSLGRTGVCFDNAVSESLFATLKKELIHTRPWVSLSVLRKGVFSWFEEYYNRKRRHSTLGYLTPHERDMGYGSIEEIAA